MKHFLFSVFFLIVSFCHGQKILEVIGLTESQLINVFKDQCAEMPQRQVQFHEGKQVIVYHAYKCVEGQAIGYWIVNNRCMGWVMIPLNHLYFKLMVEFLNASFICLSHTEWILYQRNGEILYVELQAGDENLPSGFMFVGTKK